VAIGERKVLLKAREAAAYLRISLFTLNKIERQGELIPFRTPGGHRRYSLEMLNQYLERNRLPAKGSSALAEEKDEVACGKPQETAVPIVERAKTWSGTR